MLMVGEAERRRRFGYALQEALGERKMSARQLALRMGIDARRVSAWISGKSLPDLYQTQEIVALLRVQERLFREPPPVPEPVIYPIKDYLLDDELSAARAGVDEIAPQLPADASAGDRPVHDQDDAQPQRRRGR